ncbi:uncharacterized protein LOC135350156 [Halichondria panicea]|uniref:uncharacterized protein LOC135350156 n=1 Tax=Halichondria panicea TaxID=6063 RepID=UPI00312B47AB
MTDSISMETVAITVSCSAGSERESSVNEPATGQGSEDLEPVSVNPELEAAGHSQHILPEELPEYASVVVQRDEGEGTDGLGGVLYENLQPRANKDSEAAREAALISEAPPTYRQLFGHHKKKRTIRQTLQRHTQPRSQSLFQKLKERLENNKLASTFVVSGAILLLLSLPVAMIIIGGLNVGVCVRHEIPLYLLIAGFIFVAEIIFQFSMCMGIKRSSQHESIYRTLRMFDCLALFLFIWLLVGTYWLFTISIARSGCTTDTMLNDFVVVNTTVLVDSEGGTQISVMTPPPSLTPSGDCLDCDTYVYSFTAFVIMFQYLTFLVCFVACCSVYFKKYGR